METFTHQLDDIEDQLLRRHVEDRDDGYRQLTQLAGVSLAMLVALQGQYVPADPEGLWLLQIAWIALGVCTCAGLQITFGSAQDHLTELNRLRQVRRKVRNDEAVVHELSKAGRFRYARGLLVQFASQVMPLSYLSAVVLLTAFAALNLS